MVLNFRRTVYNKIKSCTSLLPFFTGKIHHFNIHEPSIFNLEKRLTHLVNLELTSGEKTIGMYFSEGEHFKLHTNYFEKHEYDNYCLEKGNRFTPQGRLVRKY